MSMVAVNDGLISGEYDAADILFLTAAILFAIVTFIHLSAKAAAETFLMSLGFCLLAVALLVL